MTAPRGRVLDDEQFHRLAMYGEVEHVLTAEVDILRDTTATEPERLIYRGGPGDFLGELNLLTGQNVYLTARVVTAGTVVRIGAAMLRRVLAEQDDGASSTGLAYATALRLTGQRHSTRQRHSTTLVRVDGHRGQPRRLINPLHATGGQMSTAALIGAEACNRSRQVSRPHVTYHVQAPAAKTSGSL